MRITSGEALPAPPPIPANLLRWIVYVRADTLGHQIPETLGMLEFEGRSVFELREALADELEEEEDDITLCMRGGSEGQLIPLIVDLPSNQLALEIIVLRTKSLAAQALVYPDVGAQ
ncbi:unnamed protein product [Urochloa humidicola]